MQVFVIRLLSHEHFLIFCEHNLEETCKIGVVLIFSTRYAYVCNNDEKSNEN